MVEKISPPGGTVIIPDTSLSAKLKETAAIKERAIAMLGQLELQTKPGATTKPGAWRQNPLVWLKRR